MEEGRSSLQTGHEPKEEVDVKETFDVVLVVGIDNEVVMTGPKNIPDVTSE